LTTFEKVRSDRIRAEKTVGTSNLPQIYGHWLIEAARLLVHY